jgi:hypothetical protein
LDKTILKNRGYSGKDIQLIHELDGEIKKYESRKIASEKILSLQLLNGFFICPFSQTHDK